MRREHEPPTRARDDPNTLFTPLHTPIHTPQLVAMAPIQPESRARSSSVGRLELNVRASPTERVGRGLHLLLAPRPVTSERRERPSIKRHSLLATRTFFCC